MLSQTSRTSSTLTALIVSLVVFHCVGGCVELPTSTVPRFNDWFSRPEHGHRVVRVKAMPVNGGAGLGLVVSDPSGVLPNETYLSVNSSLALSARKWLVNGGGGGQGLRVSIRIGDDDVGSRRLVLGMALHLATLRWIAGAHPTLLPEVQELSGANDVPLAQGDNNNDQPSQRSRLTRNAATSAAKRILHELNTDERDVLLALYLLFERIIMGLEDSFYGPYLAVLPPLGTMALTSVIFETNDPDKVAALEGTAVYDRIREYRTKLIGLHMQLNRTLFAPQVLKDAVRMAASRLSSPLLPPHRVEFDFPQDLLRLSSFQWAMGVLWSRQVWWDGEGHLAPMHDMANCREPRGMGDGAPPPVHRTALASSAASLDGEDGDGFVLTNATDHFGFGEELFENYGETNSFYMLFHGFALEHNTRDCAMIVLPTTASSAKTNGPHTQGAGGRAVLPTPTFEDCLSAPIRKQLRELGGYLTEPPCLGGNQSMIGHKQTEMTVPHALDSFLSTLRAGYLFTYAPRAARTFLATRSMSALKHLGRFSAAMRDERSQRCAELVKRREHLHLIRPDVAEELCQLAASSAASEGVVGVALRLVRDQLATLRPQFDLLWESPTGTSALLPSDVMASKFLVKKLRVEGRSGGGGCGDGQRGMGTSWTMIARFVRQQFQMLLKTEADLSRLTQSLPVERSRADVDAEVEVVRGADL